MPSSARRTKAGVAVALAAGLALLGCGSGDDAAPPSSTSPAAGAETAARDSAPDAAGASRRARAGADDPVREAAEQAGIEHIHSLRVAPGGELQIATHSGLWVAPAGSTDARHVGGSAHDLMGFARGGDGRLLASGHPAPGASGLPANLGLVASRDRGRSWRSVSLGGAVDFHVLESAGRRVYGIDSGSGTLLASADGGRRWRQHALPATTFSLAIDPRDARSVVIATEAGLFGSHDAGASWRPLASDVAGLLAWPQPDALYLVDADGAIHRSDDGGRAWTEVGDAGGAPAAFGAGAGALLVADGENVVRRSADEGRSWTLRAASAG